MRFHHAVRRSAAVAGVTALTALGTGGPAAADARPAQQGAYTKVSFRVPNERQDADTVKLRIDLPAKHPITSASVRAVPGWTVKITKARLAEQVKGQGGEAVSRIVWSGGRIKPGQYQEFDVSLGPLPRGADRLLFPMVQTYSGGQVVRWDKDPDVGNPDHPAPSLRLTRSGVPAGSRAAATGTTVSDGAARTLGALGLAAGVAGLVLGWLGMSRNRT
ncbi:hypothetical protein DPM19_13110 [Actinomadura craniellae]|uniref:YncI copper-binding domain-containing protein n=1 Tax=Actinomadura craniellae TaxID=2231787 RepID=A0A365H6S7_9ACTN|nr:YcnI family protein [Actinomadura craniellae]RAY14686.1 hypothetical protein DPM19_13110 [Actinomadura craniellae]